MTKRLTIEDCVEFVESLGWRFLSTEYVNNSTKYEVECQFGHRWFVVYYNIKNGNGCPICAKKQRHTIEDCNIAAAKHGGVCLSVDYVNNKTDMLWRCPCGNEWWASLKTILKGHWCSKCSHNKKRGCIDDCHELARKRGGKCLSTIYIDNRTKYEWECSCGNRWFAQLSRIQQGRWCPRCCNQYSKQEFRIFKHYKRLILCFNRKKGLLSRKGLELDIWFPTLMKAIEYDGDYWHSRPGAAERDARKDSLCKEAGIKLLRIKESEFKAHPNKTYKKIDAFLRGNL